MNIKQWGNGHRLKTKLIVIHFLKDEVTTCGFSVNCALNKTAA